MYLNYAPSPLSWIYVIHESVYPRDASDVFTVTKTDSSDLKLLTNIKMSEHVHVFLYITVTEKSRLKDV